MTDLQDNLLQDWIEFKNEVRELIRENPDITIQELMEKTGGEYEDVLWAARTNR